jgi:hypothetical protein
VNSNANANTSNIVNNNNNNNKKIDEAKKIIPGRDKEDTNLKYSESLYVSNSKIN